MKKYTYKRVLALVLTAVMLCSMLPAVASAEGETKTATLITSTDGLLIGDKVVIVAVNSDKAMSTIQKNNNRGDASITRGENGTITFSSDVEVFTVGEGEIVDEEATLTFCAGSSGGYLYAPDAQGNYLRTGTAQTTASLWKVSISGGVADIVNCNPNAKATILRHNASSSLFSCYSAGNSQKDVALYKVIETVTPPVVTEQVATPVGAVASGEIASGTEISFSCGTEGAVIWYKNGTDGEWVEYEEAFPLTEAADIYVKATKDGMTDSDEVSFAYTIKAEEPPVSDVKYAKLASALADKDEFIFYFDNGKLVMSGTATGTKLTGVEATPNGEFIALAEGMLILTAEYNSDAGSYKFKSADGKYLTTGATGNSLTLEETANDYSLWTLSAVEGGFHVVSVNAKYKEKTQALEYYNAFTTYSENTTAAYIFNIYKLTYEEPAAPAKAAAPVASPEAGEIAKGTEVSFTSGTEGATISYKTSETGEWQLYAGPIAVTEAATFIVKASKDGMTDSDEVSFAYTIKAADAKYAKLASALADKDEFIFYYDNGKLVMSGTATGTKLTGVGAEPNGEFIALADGMLILTAEYDSTVGSYKFKSADGKYLTTGATGNSLTLEETANDYSLWTLSAVEGGFHVVSVNAKYKEKTQALEYYNAFTTYSEGTTAAYIFNIYKLTDEAPVAPAKAAAPVASPEAGEIAKGTEVSFTSGTEGATISYKTSETGEWQVYAEPIAVTEAATFIVKASKDGMTDSDEVSFAYTIKAGEPPVSDVKYAKYSTALADGDEFIFYYDNSKLVIGNTASGVKLAGVSAEPEKGFIALADGMLVLMAEYDSTAGSYKFKSADGKYLTTGATGNSLTLADTAGDYSLWTLSAVSGGFHVVSVNAKYNGNSQALEYYSGFTTFTEKDNAYYIFNIYKLTDELPPEDGSVLKNGDQVVIYNIDAGAVLGLEDELQASLSAVGATIEDGKANVENGGRVFTVHAENGVFSFESGGKYLATNPSENLFLAAADGEDTKWTLTDKNTGYIIYSQNIKYNNSSPVCIEYFTGAFSGWTYKSSTPELFVFGFYPVTDGTVVKDGIVDKPSVSFGNDKASVGIDYVLKFDVDSVFGIDSMKVTLGEEELEWEAAEEGFTATVPVEKVTGEKLSFTVSGMDEKGVSFSGTCEVPVEDVPVIKDFSPAANAETGDDKRPLIKATIINAGENPVITVTINGDEETATAFNDGELQFMPAADLADGLVTVTIKVTREDSVSAEVTWKFYVGVAQYQLYFGQLHSHTTYSDGSGTLAQALNYVVNLPKSANVQFVAFTDHSNYFDKSGAANPEGALYDITLATDFSRQTWEDYGTTIENFNAAQSDIVAIKGFEMTWSGGPGHINTFNTPGIVSRNNSTLNNKTDNAGLKAYYSLLSRDEGSVSISQFNHPGTTFGNFIDFSYWDAAIDSRMYLLEVGNGEGAIGSGGYFPSYEQYIMALDKGWHVAPTNNQDNHKGKWGNANDGRDVILTEDFSTGGLFNAIRQYRVYATEDKNLSIWYECNGEPLGTTFAVVPETLSFSIRFSDPDSTDSIKSVELVVNSGKTVYSWTEAADLNSGEVSVDLAPEYSYYFVRITEADGDIAVTAPVWVGESLKLGITSFDASTSNPVTGEEMTLTTTLFNSESSAATVKSLTYTTNGSVVLGTDTGTDGNGYTLPASGTVAVPFKYTPDKAKVMTVTVTAVIEQNGKEYTFSKDVELDVMNSENVKYIGVDASHYNEYVAGNYKDSIGNFTALAAQYSVKVQTLETSEALIAACGDEKYIGLIITAPSRRLQAAQENPATFSDDEIAAIKSFSQSGGFVVVSGWSDYYENYDSVKNLPTDQHMAGQLNKILEALGSSLRIGDDATNDDELNGGQTQRLYFSTYNFDSYLLEGVEYDSENPNNNMYTELYSQYGGASVYAVDSTGAVMTGTLPSTVTPVVFGHASTYVKDSDGDNASPQAKYDISSYNTEPAVTVNAEAPSLFALTAAQLLADGGTDERIMVMATEELDGMGEIIVSGAAFMSNFEVQATVEDSAAEKNYSNYKISENLLKDASPEVITPIEEVRDDTEAGYKYTIEGTVTSNASGYDQNTAFFDCIYVQDDTGGICCFPVAGKFKLGDKVRVTGTTDFYQGEPELQVTSINKISDGTPLDPTEVGAKDVNDGTVTGDLVTVKGTVTSFEKENDLVQTIMVKDANGDTVRVFIDGYICKDKDVENISEGCDIEVTGLASYDDTFNSPDGPFPRIRVRNREEVICTEAHVHDFGEWAETTKPTCVKPGEATRSCACGVTETKEIPATGKHSYGEWETIYEADCEDEGLARRECENCDAYEEKVLPKTEHKWGSWKTTRFATKTRDGLKYRKCEVCGAKEEKVIPAGGTPATGDTSNATLWIVLMIVFACVIAAAVIVMTKKRKGNK